MAPNAIQAATASDWRRLDLVALAGVPVRLHVSWLPLAALLTWSLRESVFPVLVPELTAADYWRMAVAGVIGVVASAIARDLPFVLVARRAGIAPRGVTIHAIGGVAEGGPGRGGAWAELKATAVAVLAALLLGFLLLVVLFQGAHGGAPLTVAGVLFFLAGANALLAVLAMVPALPFHGGRVLAAAMAHWTGDAARARRLAAGLGWGLAALPMALGVALALGGHAHGAVWCLAVGVLIGFALLEHRHEGADRTG